MTLVKELWKIKIKKIAGLGSGGKGALLESRPGGKCKAEYKDIADDGWGGEALSWPPPRIGRINFVFLVRTNPAISCKKALLALKIPRVPGGCVGWKTGT